MKSYTSAKVFIIDRIEFWNLIKNKSLWSENCIFTYYFLHLIESKTIVVDEIKLCELLVAKAKLNNFFTDRSGGQQFILRSFQSLGPPAIVFTCHLNAGPYWISRMQSLRSKRKSLSSCWFLTFSPDATRAKSSLMQSKSLLECRR